MNDTTPQETTRPQETTGTQETVTHVTKQGDLLNDSRRGLVQEATKTKKWNITPSMYKWVDTAVELITDSPSDISAKCNIARITWYRWTTLPGFEEWFYNEYKSRRKRWVPKLDAMGMARASKNFDYWKAMNEKAGDPIDGGGTTNNFTGEKVVAIMGGLSLQTVHHKLEQTTTQQDTQLGVTVSQEAPMPEAKAEEGDVVQE